jgi:hypothetical protein
MVQRSCVYLNAFDGEAFEFLPLVRQDYRISMIYKMSQVAFSPETGQNNFASLNLQG